MHQTVSSWLAIFGSYRHPVHIEAWDQDGRAMIVDPKRAQLIYVDQQPDFSHLEKSPMSP